MLRSGEAHELLSARTIDILDAAGVPFLIGGTFALGSYTGEPRLTKDLDMMLRGRDVPRALDALRAEGFETAVPYPHWLAKATQEDFVVDLIFASGNGVARVDDEWFAHARPAQIFDRRVLVSPPEELLWSKAFVMERERYDGADVVHLLWSQGRALDWERVERRFGDLLPVLYMHLIELLFAYSDGADRLPPGLFERIQRRAQALLEHKPATRLCRGTLISREQYLHDLDAHGYVDARQALGTMSDDDVETWTAAIEESK